MIIKELIEELQKYNPDLLVYLSGYEGGLDDLNYIKDAYVIRDTNKEWYYGRHTESRISDISETYTIKGIFLGAERKD